MGLTMNGYAIGCRLCVREWLLIVNIDANSEQCVLLCVREWLLIVIIHANYVALSLASMMCGF